VTSTRLLSALCGSCLLLGACVGNIGGDDDALDPAEAAKNTGWSQPHMLRLTQQQYINSVQDVFGAAIIVDQSIEDDETNELFLSMGAAKVGTSEYGVEQYHGAAIDIANQVVSNAADTLLSDCAPYQPGDACIDEIIAHYGRLLWRRALTDEEIARLSAVVGATGEDDPAVWQLGMTFAIAALLDSPYFIYLPMVGELDEANGVQRYTNHEMASRMSYVLWGSTPDDELLRAAEDGELTSRDSVLAQAERMMKMPRGESLSTRFFGESWLVSQLDYNDKSTAAFPSWTPALVETYQQEFDAYLRELIVERDGDILELFKPLNDGRYGLLTSGAVMSAVSPSDRTSPTYRGVFVLERLLCSEVPPPPPSVDDTLDAPTQEEGLTLVEKLAQHRDDPVCATCHNIIDPLGLPFEHFDGIGEYRDLDAGQPIDASAELNGELIDGAGDLVEVILDDPRLLSCLAERLFGFATAHEPVDAELDVVDGLTDGLRDHRRFNTLMVDIVTSDAFRYLEPSE
jgi:hypothetical protein